jgi:hypothetical protein
MRKYLITLGFMAVLLGAIWKGGELTGIRQFKEAADAGALLFAVVGTIAAARWQANAGKKALEAALKSLEPEGILTDWSAEKDDRPDYLVVGPGGLVAVVVDDLAQSTFKGAAARKVMAARFKAEDAVRWLRDQLTARSAAVQGALDGATLNVTPVVVLLRRRALPEYSADGVKVINPEGLADFVRSTWTESLLDKPARVRVTRLFREEGTATTQSEDKTKV